MYDVCIHIQSFIYFICVGVYVAFDPIDYSAPPEINEQERHMQMLGNIHAYMLI